MLLILSNFSWWYAWISRSIVCASHPGFYPESWAENGVKHLSISQNSAICFVETYMLDWLDLRLSPLQQCEQTIRNEGSQFCLSDPLINLPKCSRLYSSDRSGNLCACSNQILFQSANWELKKSSRTLVSFPEKMFDFPENFLITCVEITWLELRKIS